MNYLGLLPARGGSKGLLGKNIINLAGQPLLAHTASAAQQSLKLGLTFLSTDDDEIAKVGETMGLTILKRPENLAEDVTPMLPVMRHAVESAEEKPDAIVLLQPTSPLRTVAHINEAIALFEETNADTVVSVVKVPHQFGPSSLMEETDGKLHALPNVTLDRHDKPKLYARNGPAILIIKTEFLMTCDNFYTGQTVPYVMDAQSSVDIDTAEDLALAEFYLAQGS